MRTLTSRTLKMTETTKSRILTLAVMLALILAGTFRSARATRLDGFTLDESYHIAAGVSYVRTGDYRLNPEHPPLVKLWVGTFLPASSFNMPPLRALADKEDERRYAADAVFVKNDPEQVQRRSRLAMFWLNGLLLLGFAIAVWRVLGPALAIGALAFLMIDPTVAAHMPVVMTDLPIALTASTAFMFAWAAFDSWRVPELILAGLALGLALGSKHSAPIVVLAVAALGLWAALRRRQDFGGRLARVAAVLLVGWVVLWGMYRFRYDESPAGVDLFNRPLAAKIDDLSRPVLRQTVSAMAAAHLFPRSYLWGLADILRAGIEGRNTLLYLWDRCYMRKTPLSFFPTAILVKVPIGLLVLSLLGLGLLVLKKLPSSAKPLPGALCFSLFWLFVLMAGNSGYAGMRHVLPVVPGLALLGGAAVVSAYEKKSVGLSVLVGVGVVAAMVSALPVMRPWEYYNEFAGGANNAYRHFNDEGIDLEQRVKELSTYYHAEMEPKGQIPFLEYELADEDLQLHRLGVRTMQMVWNEDESKDTTDLVEGTVIENARWIAPTPFYDYAELRAVEPTRRLGNLLIYEGKFHIPSGRAYRLQNRAVQAIYSQTPDLDKGERLLREAAALAPHIFTFNLDLGNVLAKQGKREDAIRAYSLARQYAPPDEPIVPLLSQQIERVSKEDPKTVPELRDPSQE